MKDRKIQIKEALENLISLQHHRDFQWLAVQLAKTKWPELEATQEQSDGGEDATTFFNGSDGKRRALACSLTGTLAKVKEDAKRIKQRGVAIDVLVFMTPVPITLLVISDWRKEFQEEFQHDLHVIPQAELNAMLEQPTSAWLCRDRLKLDFPDELQMAEAEALLKSAATEMLKGWKAEYHYEMSNSIELAYVQDVSSDGATASKAQVKQFSVHDVSQMLTPGGRVTVAGQPGAGKTFTLIQLTDLLLQNTVAPIPILVSLPGWASSGADFLPYIAQQTMAYKLDANVLARLTITGRAVFLLNGWNEIPEGFMEKANSQLRTFILNYPAVSLILSTRENRVSSPLSSANVIHVKPLSSSQKSDIIKKSGLPDSSALIRDLETNVALAEVTDTPLFLSALINLTRAGGPLPTTRSGILKSFIEQSESNSEHSAALNALPCLGFYRIYLDHIAEAMTQAAAITLRFDELLTAIAKCSKMLQSQGHLSSVPHSPSVVDCLVKHHLLVLSPSLGGAYRFVHQQFQEWFAAEGLHQRISELVKNEEPDDVFHFQRDILNHRRWQQPIFFLLERVANGNDNDLKTAAKLIRWAMPVDLLLAAEMAGIAGEHVWLLIHDDLNSSLRKWHEKAQGGHRHCALAAMFATGSPEFEDILWPLLNDDEQQIRLWACRIWRPFSLSSLGVEWRRRFANWDSARKTEFIHEIGWRPSHEHIAFALELAKDDNDFEVKLACYDLLKGAGAYEALTTIAESPAFGKWKDELPDEVFAHLPKVWLGVATERLKAALQNITALDVRKIIIARLQQLNAPAWIDLAKAEIDQIRKLPHVEFRPDNHSLAPTQLKPALQNVAPYIAVYLKNIYEAAPQWAMDWLAQQLESGHFWWKPFTDYLIHMSDAQMKIISDAALDPKLDVKTIGQHAELLANSGSSIAAKAILREYLAFTAQKSTQTGVSAYDRGEALKAGIRELPVSVLADAIIDEAKGIKDAQVLYALLKLIMPGSPLGSTLRLQLSASQKASLRSLIFLFDELSPFDSKEKPFQRAYCATFLGTIGNPEDAKALESWIAEEQQRLVAEEAERQEKWVAWNSSGRKTHFPNGFGRVNYSNWYQGGLVNLDCAESADVFLRLLHVPAWFGDAAWGLFYLGNPEALGSNSQFGNRQKYEEIYERRQIWENSGKILSGAVKIYTDAIFEAIQTFLPELEKSDSKFPKQQFVAASSALAGLNDIRAIPILLKLSSDKNYRWAIMLSFHGLAYRGVAFSGSEAAGALEPFITEHEKQSWGNNDNFYAVVQCIAALLFSDTAAVGIERIRRLPPERLHTHDVREILRLLGVCRAPEAARLLVEYTNIPEIMQRWFYDLVAALSENANPEAWSGLIALLNRASVGQLQPGHDTFDPLAKAIVRKIQKDPTLWTDIKSRCGCVKSEMERGILSQILSELDNANAAETLCDLINDKLPIHYQMVKLIENAVTNRIPAGGSAYYIKPRVAKDLRKRLFGIAQHDVHAKKSAFILLDVIAKHRIEYGFPLDEPLHPDVDTLKQSQIPWQLMQ